MGLASCLPVIPFKLLVLTDAPCPPLLFDLAFLFLFSAPFRILTDRPPAHCGAYTEMSPYAYLFKYIIIGDTGVGTKLQRVRGLSFWR